MVKTTGLVIFMQLKTLIKAMHTEKPQVTIARAQQLGLSEEELETIKKQLGRTPNELELQIFASMWSEHCSLKSSLLWLKTLPREGRQTLASFGEENSGLVDLGEGLACVLQFSSCLPSNPHAFYQEGLSTVGKAHRKILSRGARPLVSLNALRLGEPQDDKSLQQLGETVKGIADFGNQTGIPTAGGDVFFDQAYGSFPQINVFSIGLVQSAEAVPVIAKTPGDLVFLLGATTSNGAISFQPAENHSTLAVSSPFSQKLLMEALLEAIPKGAISGMRPLESAGIPGAAAEMSARGRTGMLIQVDGIPVSGPSFDPSQLLLSQSQEKWLLTVQPGKEKVLLEIVEKWELQCTQIGTVTDSGTLDFIFQGQTIARINASSLVAGFGVPAYQREYQKPEYLKKTRKYNPNKVPKPKDYLEVARKICQSPNVLSRRWIYEQFDAMAGANTISKNLPCNAAILRMKGMKKALTLSVDGNPVYVKADPYVGAMIAVCEAARNITCSGGEALTVSHALNFGDPEDPGMYWQFVNAIKGIGDACRKFEIPVTGGDVTFSSAGKDQSTQMDFLPGPVVGMLGRIEDLDHVMTLHFKEEGHQIYMLGTPHNDFACSEYIKMIHNISLSPSPKFDLDEEYHNLYNLRVIIRKKLILSAHDISEGGLFVSLLEAALPNGLGFDIETDNNFRKDAYLFGESQSRIIVSVTLENEDELVNYLNSHNVSFSKLGEVSGRRIMIDNQDFGQVKDWKKIYENTLAEKLDN